MQGSGHAPPRFAVAVLLAAVLGVFAGPARADETFTFAGHGYGHGVGMPQYGAEGYALAGGSYQQILSLYYPGTTLGTTPPNTQIRVLLQSGQPSVQISSATGLMAHDETSGTSVAVPSAAVVTQSSGTYSVSSPDGVPLAAGWAGPVLLSPAGASPVMLVGNALFGGSNRTYRGSIRVVLGTTGLAAINVLPLEDYLRGVVPSEMSSSWRPAALAAQAVAARSYALATAGPSTGLFDEYADTRSQAYAGVLAEKPETDAAIAATSGQVLTYAGKTAVTYFSSSSGGRTANVQEVFANAQPTPYLVAVDDPYDAASPYHDWTLTLTGRAHRAGARLRRHADGGLDRPVPVRARALAGARRQRGPEGRCGRHRAHGARAALDVVHDGHRGGPRDATGPSGGAHARAPEGSRQAGAAAGHGRGLAGRAAGRARRELEHAGDEHARGRRHGAVHPDAR